MSVYLIGEVEVKDEVEYQQYVDNFDNTWHLFDGELLTADFNAKVVEGSFSCNKVIILKFPNEEEYERWYNSPEYQQGIIHRHNAANSNLLLVHGLD